jgi:hypothetical protein
MLQYHVSTTLSRAQCPLDLPVTSHYLHIQCGIKYTVISIVNNIAVGLGLLVIDVFTGSRQNVTGNWIAVELDCNLLWGLVSAGVFVGLVSVRRTHF